MGSSGADAAASLTSKASGGGELESLHAHLGLTATSNSSTSIERINRFAREAAYGAPKVLTLQSSRALRVVIAQWLEKPPAKEARTRIREAVDNGSYLDKSAPEFPVSLVSRK